MANKDQGKRNDKGKGKGKGKGKEKSFESQSKNLRFIDPPNDSRQVPSVAPKVPPSKTTLPPSVPGVNSISIEMDREPSISTQIQERLPHGFASSHSSSSNNARSNDKKVLRLTGVGFLPSHIAANEITDIIKSHYHQA